MKQIVVLAVATLVSTFCFAANHSLDALGNAWKSHHSTNGASLKDPKDITIVYGGEDVSHRPTLSMRTTII